MKRTWFATLLCLFGLFALPMGARAQGVTTAAVSGTVTGAEGAPLQGITITATNTATGTQARVVTRSDGRYLLSGLQPGSYRLEARGLGYAPATRTGVNLALSQTEEVDFGLVSEALALEGLTVSAERSNDVISKGRTGASTVVNDSAIHRLPTITRDFTDFTRLTPQISTGGAGTSAAGRNNRFNSIQIDGAVNNDLFGLAASGTPGGQAGTKPITLEAIQEFQVVIAPFDVRQNGFTGAGINAITKSGTNELDGSFSFYGRNQDFVGNFNVPGTGEESDEVADFDESNFAGAVGGPILRDRLFFFVAGERTTRSAPVNTVVGTPSTGLSVAQAEQVADYLRTTFGYDAGAIGAVNLDRESTNLFGRLDFNINGSNRLTLRHNYVDAGDDNLSRGFTYNLGNGGYRFSSTTNSTVGQLNSQIGGFFNELRIGFTTIRDKRDITDRFPAVLVQFPEGNIAAGPDPFSVANALDQDVLEVTNDLTIPLGRHNVVIGTNNEFFDFSNLFVANGFGSYQFASFEDLQAGTPFQFDYTYQLPGGNERAEFPVRRYGVYIQDRWDATDRLTLTGGLRYDYTDLPDTPAENPAVEQAIGVRNDVAPSSGLFNPRFGFNYDVNGDATTQVRGGTGLFSGRTPYVWVSNAYGNTGVDYATFRCRGSSAPPPNFVADPDNQPQNCAGSTTPISPSDINTIDPDFEQPQVIRSSLAIDQRLPLGFTGTLEGIYTKTRRDVAYRNLAIVGPTGRIVEGRPQYSTLDLRSVGLGSIYDATNTELGHTWSVTAQLQRDFQDRWSAEAAYTYGRAEDVSPLSSSRAVSNFRFNPIKDSPNNPGLATSNFDIRHRIVASGSYQAMFLRRAPTDLSLIYVGQSGSPYSFTYQRSDINGDGSADNDLIFVPASAADINFQSSADVSAEQSFQNLDNFIQSVDCLQEARGTVIDRNACREPWSSRIDVRLAQTVPTLRGQGVQVTLDILNFANLLSRDWGLSEFVGNQNFTLLRTASGSTPDANGHFTYRPFVFDADEDLFTVSDLGSRYQIQLGVRYEF